MNNRSLPFNSLTARRAAQQERQRIGNELHDNINPILTSAQLYLSALQAGCPDFETIKARTAEIISMAIEEVRCLAHNFVSPGINEQQLVEYITQIVNDIRNSRRFLVSFHHSDAGIIESQAKELKFTLRRIIQEQVRNICKHSEARTISLSLDCSHDQVRLQITDDGIGFDAKKISPGVGITNIVQRVTHLKGKALIQTAPGKGCTLIVIIPLTQRRIF